MGIKSFLSRPLAYLDVAKARSWAMRPAETQQRVFQQLLHKGAGTAFGRDHGLADVRSYEDFKAQVPVRDYEGLRPYLDRTIAGEADVLWPGLPAYLAKTSGTTSGVKYIPITADSVPNHLDSAKSALLHYIHESGNSAFVDRQMIFLSGSPALSHTSGIPTGRLSGISNHFVPAYLRRNQLPSYATNCIEDWEEKLERIVDETLQARMSLISGIPPWVQMYFDRITARSGRSVKEVFPDFSVFVYGGVNFEPYRQKLFSSIGAPVDSIELYPASEGFIAFQDSQHAPGMRMQLDSGIFFEFIPAERYFDPNPPRLRIQEVELGKNYALVINSNAGLWGYSIGDTVKFVSRDPYRLLVTGRIKHFISASGEHVIGEEVEQAMKYALERHPETQVVEFTVAPQVSPAQGLPHHEWLVAFGHPPLDMQAFARDLDECMCALNVYYKDLIVGRIHEPLHLTRLQPDAFQHYMRSIGKLGGQNKVPRLSNDRQIAEALLPWQWQE